VTAPRSEPGRLYVVEQTGRIRIVENGRKRSQPFLDVRRLVSCCGEQGLLSVAFHPRYADNRLLYVNYTDVNGDTKVVEYRSEGNRVLPRTARELLFVDQPYANHNGGQLVFGPDGFLYVGMGDGGSAGDPGNVAQNLRSRLGKLLRLNVDKAGAKWQIAALGLRNPWRFSFDRANGDLYIGDVGQGEWEEIDYVRAGKSGIENYGWDVFEGRHSYESKRRNPAGRLVQPIAEYSHSNGCSVTGGFVYRGSLAPALRGQYFYGDYCSGIVWSLRVASGKATGLRRESVTVQGLSSFGEDAEGEVYLVSQAGTIYRLAAG
jgi:glucose/arabinose dehydrogenase